jgi:murein DD-endopeptidase MepM/ murein hydrolase activator NlpD
MAERLSLHYPVRPYFLNQRFGDNKPCVIDFGKPTQKVIDSYANGTCPAGSDKLYAHFGMSGHNGDDLAAGEQPVFAAASGIVIEKQTVPARGLGLGILTDEEVLLDGFGTHFVKVRYWHLKSMLVEVGDKVVIGQQIGISDNTGYSSANHLHFEIQPMDKDAGGHPMYAWTNVAFPPGVIAGAIDPTPYFSGVYADVVPQVITLNQRLIVLLQTWLNALRERSKPTP